jgi:general secretion pathway protein K
MLLQRRGFVLIFALWVLGFLTVLAVGVASGIRQKIVMIEKLDKRSRLSHLEEGAVKYAASYIDHQFSLFGQLYTLDLKINLHNNAAAFGQFDLGEDNASIIGGNPGDYGVIDEERKININTTNVNTLSRLIERVLGAKPDDAKELAQSILDWRYLGESQLTGFFSDEYYANLADPYGKKNGPYETPDELLLVKGMTKEKYQKLINYVTIYGDGKVNINTAPLEVLYALGLEDSLIEKLLEVRQGKDRLEATADDYVFSKSFDIATELNKSMKLQPDEIHAIDRLNQQNFLSTTSYYFSINVQPHLAHSSFTKTVYAIISSREGKIVYWKER